MHGRVSGKVRAFALYGDTTGESDEFGLPVRLNWAANYRGGASVIYGHTPTLIPEWVNRCICIDTGCVFGGRLTALRWPEQEFVSVPAEKQYAEPKLPAAAQNLTPHPPSLEGRGGALGEPERERPGRRCTRPLPTRFATPARPPSLQGGGSGG